MGNVYAIIGAAIAMGLAGAGSCLGVMWVQQASAGVISEDPEKYGKTLILQLIPSSQALYGFVVAFLIIANVLFTADFLYTDAQGLSIMYACIPIGLVGLFSASAQGRVCASGVIMLGKNGELSGRALTMAVFTELFALFALIISVLVVLQIGG